MNKIKLKYIIDIGMLVSFVLVAVTGIIKFPKFLRSLGVDTSNIPFYELSRIHDWSGIALTILVLIHLFLNFNWIVNTTKKLFKTSK